MKERLQLLERFINKLPIALKVQSFAELGIDSMGPIKREPLDEIGRSGHQMFENMERLDNGTCREMYTLPNECFPTVDNNGQDNFELLESESLFSLERIAADSRTDLSFSSRRGHDRFEGTRTSRNRIDRWTHLNRRTSSNLGR